MVLVFVNLRFIVNHTFWHRHLKPGNPAARIGDLQPAPVCGVDTTVAVWPRTTELWSPMDDGSGRLRRPLEPPTPLGAREQFLPR